MSLDLTKQRLESAVRRVETFIDQNISTWATEEVLLPAQTDLANSISEKDAIALSIDKSGWMKVDLVWDLRGDNNEPLHFYLEFGTDAHKIRPKGKEHGGANVLHWKGPSGGFVIGLNIVSGICKEYDLNINIEVQGIDAIISEKTFTIAPKEIKTIIINFVARKEQGN